MRHSSIDQLSRVAAVTSEVPLTRRERLARWAELLNREPQRLLATLVGTEYEARKDRDTMRAANSPFSIAFADPLLRASGLKDDTYGEAKRFFQLSDHQLHNIVCACHFGGEVPAAQVARHVRSAERRSALSENVMKLWKWLVGRESKPIWETRRSGFISRRNSCRPT